jgi:phosphohistidine swiveling domain-containing protein
MGKPYGISFTTNTLFVESIGKVLVRGQKFKHSLEPFLGEVTILFPGEERDISNKIVVTTKVLETQLHLFLKAKAIILQNHPLDKRSEDELAKLYETYRIPYIARADAAIALLKEGEKVRFDATLGLIFKGESPNEKEMLKECSL